MRGDRRLLDVPAKGVSIEVSNETRGDEHSRAIEETLAQNGFALCRL